MQSVLANRGASVGGGGRGVWERERCEAAEGDVWVKERDARKKKGRGIK